MSNHFLESCDIKEKDFYSSWGHSSIPVQFSDILKPLWTAISTGVVLWTLWRPLHCGRDAGTWLLR